MAEKNNQKNNQKNIPQKKSGWNKVWAVIGLALLFGCGVVVGLCFNANQHAHQKPMPKEAHMAQPDCEQIAKRIVVMQGDDSYKRDGKYSTQLREAKKIYREKCQGQKVSVDQQKPSTVQQPRQMPQPMVRIEPAQRDPMPQETCAAVEKILNKQLAYYWDEMSVKPDYHLTRAQIYANLSTRGCPENSETYKNMALREIEIARALNDDSFDEPDEIMDLIETYRKLNMKQEAQQAIEKIKKITDPAIDFIMQVEKIFNE